MLVALPRRSTCAGSDRVHRTHTTSAAQAILAVVRKRAVTLAPGAIVGVGVYLQSGQVSQALLACVLLPPAISAGRVLARWVDLLEPPRRWRRPRRRGS